MNAPSLASSTVLSALFSFFLSVGAAALAINLYSLLRTGQLGASWRVLIIASVLFALLQAVKLAEVSGVPYAAALNLSTVIEMVFALALAYAFFLQRQVFADAPHLLHRHPARDVDETESEIEDDAPLVSVYERDL